MWVNGQVAGGGTKIANTLIEENGQVIKYIIYSLHATMFDSEFAWGNDSAGGKNITLIKNEFIVEKNTGIVNYSTEIVGEVKNYKN